MQKWTIKTNKVMLILRTVKENFLKHIRETETPKMAWDALATLFSRKNDALLEKPL